MGVLRGEGLGLDACGWRAELCTAAVPPGSSWRTRSAKEAMSDYDQVNTICNLLTRGLANRFRLAPHWLSKRPGGGRKKTMRLQAKHESAVSWRSRPAAIPAFAQDAADAESRRC